VTELEETLLRRVRALEGDCAFKDSFVVQIQKKFMAEHDDAEEYRLASEALERENASLSAAMLEGLPQRTDAISLAAVREAKDPEERIVQLHKSCGCVTCVCESETQCGGCGAKMCQEHTRKP